MRASSDGTVGVGAGAAGGGGSGASRPGGGVFVVGHCEDALQAMAEITAAGGRAEAAQRMVADARLALREGTYRKTVEIDFDHDAGMARYQDGREFEIPGGVHDVLSAFYFVRTLDLEVGTDVFLSAHSSRETYDLRVIVHDREEVTIGLGTFDCFVIQPVMVGEGIFKHEGDLMIYLTADERRMPVLVKSELPVGSVSVELQEFTLAPRGEAPRD